jgi:steroid delta-isomerase
MIVVASAILLLSSAKAAELAEAAEDAIRSAIENWRSAFNSRDEQQVCDLFAVDIVANYQGEPTRDFASLCELLRTALRDLGATFRYSVRINEIVVYGDSAVVRLVWTLAIDRAGSPQETVEEPAVDIFRHQADGAWKISRYLAYPAAKPQRAQ